MWVIVAYVQHPSQAKRPTFAAQTHSHHEGVQHQYEQIASNLYLSIEDASFAQPQSNSAFPRATAQTVHKFSADVRSTAGTGGITYRSSGAASSRKQS